jgi:hypothetical protein
MRLLRKKKATKAPGHRYLLSGVEASGTMVFVCANCPADLRIERATVYMLLVHRSDQLRSLPKTVCQQAFPGGLTRILPPRKYMPEQSYGIY